MEIGRVAVRGGRAHGLEKLAQDGIEPADFLPRGGEVFFQLGALGRFEFLELAVEELQVDV